MKAGYDRERLELLIAQSAKELADEERHGNEYGVGTAQAFHQGLMYCVENYIDPMEAEMGRLRALVDELRTENHELQSGRNTPL